MTRTIETAVHFGCGGFVRKVPVGDGSGRVKVVCQKCGREVVLVALLERPQMQRAGDKR